MFMSYVSTLRLSASFSSFSSWLKSLSLSYSISSSEEFLLELLEEDEEELLIDELQCFS
jgi:hypothetical protein